jgi:diguanylate cyclase (GGDEF)-like protein/PAS domain S-box-containing protein
MVNALRQFIDSRLAPPARRRTHRWVVALIALSVLAQYPIQAAQSPTVEAQIRDSEAHILQLGKAIDVEVKSLADIVGDYSTWDDVYRYAGGARKLFPGEALLAPALSRLSIASIVVLDSTFQQKLSLAISTSPLQQTMTAADPTLITVIRNAVAAGRLIAATDKIHGITRTNEGLALFVVRPILQTKNLGTPNGWLLMSRHLKQQSLKDAERYLFKPVTTISEQDFASDKLPAEVTKWLQDFAAPTPTMSVIQGTELTSWFALRDVSNRPVWLAYISSDLGAAAASASPSLGNSHGRPDSASALGTVATALGCIALITASIVLFRRRKWPFQSVTSAGSSVYDMAADGVAVVSTATGRILSCNPGLQTMVGLANADVHGQFLGQFLCDPEHSRDVLKTALTRATASVGMDMILVRKDGTRLDVDVNCAPVPNTTPTQVIFYIRDLSLRRKAQTAMLATQERLDKLANHDPLTGLPNRMFLQNHLPKAIERATQSKHILAVLFLDLDRFKHINDSRGHEVGDKLLQEIARRIAAAVRPSDIVVRMGGDEFIVILEPLKDLSQIEGLATRINETLSAPVVIDGRAVVATVSIGISVFPRDGATMLELLKHSDTAMYQAKDRGRNNFQLFSPQMDRALKRRVAIESNLRAALKMNHLEVHYQPIVDIQGLKICALEALLRWKHPTHGWISPDDFISIAEETGLIIPIGEFVFQRVAADICAWRKAEVPLVPVSINISATQLERGNIKSVIQRLMSQFQIDSDLLQLELTEGSLFEKRTGTMRNDAIDNLRDLGVKIAIDDFGTGYSSLSYLKSWRVDALKIDRSFVRDIATDLSDHAIISAIIAMARSLNIQVIAEGIEGWQQFEMLRTMGCHKGQGYLFAKPCTATEAQKLLTMQTLNLVNAARHPMSDDLGLGLDLTGS